MMDVSQKIQSVKDTVGNLPERATDVVDGAKSTIDTVGGNVGEKLNGVKNSIGGGFQDFTRLPEAVSENIKQTVLNTIETWMHNHPIWAWFIHHPLWTIGLILLTLLLLWGFIGAIAQSTQKLWVFILQSPLKLVQILLGSILKSLNLPKTPFLSKQKLDKQETHQNGQQRLVEIMNRLEAMRQEQETLMQEAQSILVVKS